MENNIDPIYVLIRTSGRPKFFEKMMESIKSQTYENVITIVHTDNEDDEYVTGDIIIKGSKYPRSVGSGTYNLYNNALLDAIPDERGWYHFIDDDDMYATPDALEKFVAGSKRNHINIARSDRGYGNIWPKTWKGQRSFQTECFFLHTDHKNLGRWWASRAGDHNYSRQITDKLLINWIDDLIVCKAQEGKGRGWCLDLGENPVGNPKVKPSEVRVKYLKKLMNPKAVRGRAGDIKKMKYERALRLQAKGYVQIIISEVTK